MYVYVPIHICGTYAVCGGYLCAFICMYLYTYVYGVMVCDVCVCVSFVGGVFMYMSMYIYSVCICMFM